MVHLGTLRGLGVIVLDDQRFEGMRYEIHVEQRGQGGVKSGTGAMTGNWAAMNAAFRKGGAVLELQTGDTLEFVITSLAADGSVIKVSGPVPGY
jgi:hypothetical protein